MTGKNSLSNRVIILENIRSLHNVGSIFRTGDAAGFNAMFLTGYTGTPPDRRIEKVSLGAEHFLQWKHIDEIMVLIKDLKQQGYKIYAIEQTKESVDIFDTELQRENIAVIFGNEVTGISEEVLSACDDHLMIPMFGIKSSLNVSVAAGIALYQFR